MTPQPVSSIFLFSTAIWDLANSKFVHSLMLSSKLFFLSALSFLPFHCALQDGFGQTWWTGDISIPLQIASLYGGQNPIACWILAQTSSLVMWSLYRCLVSCGSTSFSWLEFFFAALLWGSMINKHTGRRMWQRSASIVSFMKIRRNKRHFCLKNRTVDFWRGSPEFCRGLPSVDENCRMTRDCCDYWRQMTY